MNKDGIIKKEEFLPKDIKAILTDKKGRNILEYVKYINSAIDITEISNLIETFDNKEKEKILKFINSINKYRNYNAFFEKGFIKALKNCFFMVQE